MVNILRMSESRLALLSLFGKMLKLRPTRHWLQITAIPTGRYLVDMKTVSPRFGGRAQYLFCKGRLPRLCNTPGYQGVLIHCGNTAKDTDGCILVGENKAVGKVLNSTATFRKVYAKLKAADERGEQIWITIE